MPIHVIIQVSLGDEPLSTGFALVLAFVLVAHHMHFKITLFCEALATYGALKWLDAQMFPHVDVKTRLLRV